MNEFDTTPERMILEANIQEFGHTIGMICALETGGKLSSEEAYLMIQQTWEELHASRRNLLGAAD